MELDKEETHLYYCRFCSEKMKDIELFNFISNTEVLEQIINFTKKFKIDHLDLSNDKLPNTICTACYKNIIQFNCFFMQIKQSQIILSEIYNTVEEKFSSELEVKYEENNTSSASGDNLDIVLDIKKENVFEITSNELNLGGSTSNDSGEIPISYNLYGHEDVYVSKESDILIDVKKEIEESSVTYDSWLDYSWICVHCKTKFTSIDEIRIHSKQNHKKCYCFSCVDCREKFNMFNLFIDHVRQHRPSLRYYCQYCNQKFDTTTQCFQHLTSHRQHGQEICKYCGEIMKDSKMLDEHLRKFKNNRKYVTITPHRVADDTMLLETGAEASWLDYNWSCQVCSQRLPDADALRLHIRNVHNKCFAMKCMDCAMVVKNFKMFVAHVRRHRPYLKNFCQYCNKNLKENSVTEHMKDHEYGTKQPCLGCGQMFESVDMLQKHMRQFISTRPARSLTEADLTCAVCNKVFSSLARLRQHKKTHDRNRTRNYTCDTCGKAFYELNVLRAHKLIHSEKRFACKLCEKAFHTKINLREHVAMHLDEKLFQCDECGKGFNIKNHLKYHLTTHSGNKPHKCQVCGKAFRSTHDLKIHSHQHTGLRPYSCELCDRTFVNLSNCRRHMMRRHGVSLSKKKNKTKIKIDNEAKEWIDTLAHNKHPSGALGTTKKMS